MASFSLSIPRGLDQLIASSEIGKEVVESTAEAVLANARVLAEPHRQSGHYIDELFSETSFGGSGFVGIVGDSARYAIYVEFGTYKDDPQAILRRAIDVTGLQLSGGASRRGRSG